ncbi:MAG: hypothetical protein U0T74_03870 [Chitinophagales bacterium]
MLLSTQIDSVIEKAKKLRHVNQSLLSKNQLLENDIKALKEQLADEARKIEELNNKIKIIKLAHNMSSSTPEDTNITELKRKINEYIKEIDHCITMLND